MFTTAMANSTFTGTTSGWTVLDTRTDANTGQTQWIGYKVATGSGDVPTFTSTGTIKCSYWAFTGQDPSTPQESFAITQMNNFGGATNVNVPSPNVTPTTDNCFHCVFYGEAANVATVSSGPAGYTQCFAPDNAGQSLHAAYYKALGAGSSGVAVSATAIYNIGPDYGPVWAVIVHATSSAGVSVAWFRA